MINDHDIPKAGNNHEQQDFHIRKCVGVFRTQNVIQDFINPWRIADKENLYCISSGYFCPKKVEKQILYAEEKYRKIIVAPCQKENSLLLYQRLNY